MVESVLSPGKNTVLKKQLASALRRQKLRAFLLVAPLLVFVLAFFLYPIAGMLMRSVHSPEFSQEMPRTAAALASWAGPGLPDEPVFDALVLDIRDSQDRRATGRVGNIVNVELPGSRSLFMRAGRGIDELHPPYREALLAIDDGWSRPEIWQTLQRLSSDYSDRFYLAALDLEIDRTGAIVAQPEDRRIYVPLFLRTFVISAAVTLFCLLLGFPVAYWLSILPMSKANLLMICVLLPFWTSLLVRTTAWIVLLQSQGVINSLLVWSNVIDDGSRLSLIFNRTGTIVAMTHILLPFMILPLYSVMKTVPPSYMRAARSLGANQVTAFTRIYLPQTKPGVAAGCLLVFILSLGYYITPALVGGDSGTLVSNMIAHHIQRSLNWNLAAALSTMLLAGVLVLYWVYNRLARVDGFKLG